MKKPEAPRASTQNISMSMAKARTLRLSCSRIFCVRTRGSGGAFAGSSAPYCNKALASSFSFMSVHPFQRPAQRAFGVMQPRPHRADRAPDHPRDLLVTHLFQKAQHDDFPV